MWLIILLLVPAFAEQPCLDDESVDISDGKTFSDGSIIQDGVTYPPKFIFHKNVTGEIKAFGCLCTIKNCLRKCCLPNAVIIERACNFSGKDLIMNDGIKVYNGNYFDKISTISEAGLNLVFGKPNCGGVYLETNPWYIQRNGHLYVEVSNTIPPAMIYGPDKYCIDTFYMSPEDEVPSINALVCFATEQPVFYNISSACMLISCFFILLTVAVYAWLPELRNLHGMVLIAYLLSFFVGFLVLASIQIMIMNNSTSALSCLISSFIIYFSLLAAFFWLNIMCFDIWWTFSGKRAVSNRGSSRKRFLSYCIYAFGMPTALTILLVVLEFANLPKPNALLPNLRTQGCFLYGKSKLVYLYTPILILCVANLIFFTLTAIKIAAIRKLAADTLKSKDSTRSQQKKDQQRFALYVKLFAVMGINWILEVVSSFYPEASNFWIFSDAYNVLVGLIIFIIFVCKKKTLRKIRDRIKHFQLYKAESEESEPATNRFQNGKGSELNISLKSIKKSVESSNGTQL